MMQDSKIKRWIVGAFAVLTVLSVAAGAVFAGPSGPVKSKCEKCYRGADGKIKCDPVPCP
ncbi:MAG: hypothetical protein U1F57_02200 [bacterium]